MKQNPLLKFKESMDYTYDDLADQFKVSRSVIQRAIEGAYYSLPPAVVRTLSYIEGIKPEVINKEYDEWIGEKLSSVKIPPVALGPETSLEDFDIWCSLLLRINGVSFVGEVPKLSVARLLHVNTTVIVNFYSGRSARVPEQLLERVNQIKEVTANDGL